MKLNGETSGESYMSDEHIVELYWQREEKAIEATDKKYGKYLFTIAYNIVHDKLDSEECLNDTYLGTWNSIPPARPSAFQIFVSKIMRGVAVNKFKSKTAKKRIPSELVTSLQELEDCIPFDNTVEAERAAAELGKAISEYLWSLDDDESTMFICRYYYSDKIDNIADMMNISKRTVFRELARMRGELKAKLEKEGLWNE